MLLCISTGNFACAYTYFNYFIVFSCIKMLVYTIEYKQNAEAIKKTRKKIISNIWQLPGILFCDCVSYCKIVCVFFFAFYINIFHSNCLYVLYYITQNMFTNLLTFKCLFLRNRYEEVQIEAFTFNLIFLLFLFLTFSNEQHNQESI